MSCNMSSHSHTHTVPHAHPLRPSRPLRPHSLGCLVAPRPVSTVCVSCPAKVLVSGGYAILDPHLCGLVFAVCARFACEARRYFDRPSAEDSRPALIEIFSPAYGSEWEYTVAAVCDPPLDDSGAAHADFADNRDASGADYNDHFDCVSVELSPSPVAPLSAISSPVAPSQVSAKLQLPLPLPLASTKLPAQEPDASNPKLPSVKPSSNATAADAPQQSPAPLLRIERRQGTLIEESPFIRETLSIVLNALAHWLGPAAVLRALGLHCTLLLRPDSAFYSARPSCNSKSARNSSAGSQHPGKTGLGSSAALVSSLTSCLVRLIVMTIGLPVDIDLEFMLAWLAHNAAQGKLGSGFDVSACFYGTHLFRQHAAPDLSSLFAAPRPDAISLPTGCRSAHTAAADSISNGGDDVPQHTILKLPPYLGIALIATATSCGSKTTDMVRAVLQWRRENQAECETLWSEIDQISRALSVAFRNLPYAQTFSSSHLNLQGNQLQEIRSLFKNLRAAVCKMSDYSKTEIEPKRQASILDACETIPNVIGAGIPGAGGEDAAFVIYAGHDLENIREKILSKARAASLAYAKSLSSKEDNSCYLLDVDIADEGVKLEFCSNCY